MSDTIDGATTHRERMRLARKLARAERKQYRANVQALAKAPRLVVAPGFWERLAARRLALGFTQEEVERACHPPLPKTSLSRYERRGGPIPDDHRVLELARVLMCPLEDLVNPSAGPVELPPSPRMAVVRNGWTREQ